MNPVDDGRRPRHIAIIMDGNGRWAHSRDLPRVRGHEEGIQSVREVARECARLGLIQLTLYAFSVENWKRPKREVEFLMRLLERFLVSEREEIEENNIRFAAIGRLHELPSFVVDELNRTIEMSKHNTGLTLCLALNYGGRAEILDATRRIASLVREGKVAPEQIDETLFERCLYAPEMPPPDLLIRTAGEMRVSNFLLWQISYAEIYVSSVCWPDFRREELHRALEAYSKRVRKFGGLQETNVEG
ncbi:MAG: isoprenyl transferase [Planctomycetes bacterium]|nr:isoprenyl transferase [Planctomycetota bacterium]MBI3847460.1 isoprenyl transferase [Planctomycetota bacterium]